MPRINTNSQLSVHDNYKIMNIINPYRFSGNNGLIAYYPFNGNANDESGNGNDGTVNGAVLTSDRNSNPNAAYQFDGSNDYIDIGVTAPLVGSIEVIFKYTSGGNYVYIGTQGVSDGRCYVGIHSSGKFGAGIGVDAYNVHQISFALTADTYYHGVVTWDGNDVKIYFNGNIEYTGNQNGDVNTVRPYIIGGNNNNSSYQLFAPTTTDSVRIYDKVLSAQEVTDLYDNF